jgi:hypothetical protein
MKTTQFEIVVILTDHKIRSVKEPRMVPAQARYIFSRNGIRPPQLEQICGEPASLAVELQAMRGALTLYLQNNWPVSIIEAGRITVLGRLDDSATWVFLLGSAKKDKPQPKLKSKSRREQNGQNFTQRTTGVALNDTNDNDEKSYTYWEARAAARKWFGKNARILQDYTKSSPDLRQEAKRYSLYAEEIIGACGQDVPKRVFDMWNKQMHLAKAKSTYYQFKIGRLFHFGQGCTIFVGYAEGDSWHDCLETLRIRNEDKHRKRIWGVSGDGTFHDKCIGK